MSSIPHNQNKENEVFDVFIIDDSLFDRSRSKKAELLTLKKDGETLPARIACVRNKSNRKDWLALISTDTNLSEEEIIRVYGKRWGH